ncbi:MAG: aminotransferase class I/II-fold pyridoxal phosphate-dependent enzyme [Chloroflexota bacterium]
MLRTFSKLAGLAGLRVGYGVPGLVCLTCGRSGSPTRMASLAALASLEDQDWLHDKLACLVAERERMIACLAEFEYLRPYPSHSNFVLFAWTAD